MTNRKKTLFTATMMLTTVLIGAMSLVPSASAHPCSAADPETACGDCPNDIIAHDHDYSDGTEYCSSPGCDITDAICIVSAIIED